MEDEIKTVDEMMADVTRDLLAEAQTLESGTEDHAVVLECALKTHRAWLDSAKIGAEYQDRMDQREHEERMKRLEYEHEEKMKKLEYEQERERIEREEKLRKEESEKQKEAQSKSSWFQAGIEIGKTLIPVLGIIFMTNRSYVKEAQGLMITSQASKVGTSSLTRLIR